MRVLCLHEANVLILSVAGFSFPVVTGALSVLAPSTSDIRVFLVFLGLNPQKHVLVPCESVPLGGIDGLPREKYRFL